MSPSFRWEVPFFPPHIYKITRFTKNKNKINEKSSGEGVSKGVCLPRVSRACDGGDRSRWCADRLFKVKRNSCRPSCCWNVEQLPERLACRPLLATRGPLPLLLLLSFMFLSWFPRCPMSPGMPLHRTPPPTSPVPQLSWRDTRGVTHLKRTCWMIVCRQEIHLSVCPSVSLSKYLTACNVLHSQTFRQKFHMTLTNKKYWIIQHMKMFFHKHFTQTSHTVQNQFSSAINSFWMLSIPIQGQARLGPLPAHCRCDVWPGEDIFNTGRLMLNNKKWA